ncbi:MAG: ATP-dependent DNA helicase [Methermicoccaceae archaeon]
MKITECGYPFPDALFEIYRARGIDEFYPPQEEAIRAGLLEGRNLLAAVPTASGKTLIAELAMVRSVLEGGKALYIVPLRALATEKHAEFSELAPLGVRVGISTGDFDVRDESLGECDIIVATCEKVDSLIRNGSSWIESITCLVVDEIHHIDSPTRGPTLEMTVAKLKRMLPEVQIVALSATVENTWEVAAWLNAMCVVSEWRPVPLKEGVFLDGVVEFSDGTLEEIEQGAEPASSLVAHTVAEGGQCLVFESTRQNAESCAKRMAQGVQLTLSAEDEHALETIAEKIVGSSEVLLVKKLAACVRRGSAFHHAGLDASQRTLVEGAFRAGHIKCVVSTPTLAFGLNLPARMVVVKGFRRYDPEYGSVLIPVLEYKQMAGRAGRPALDPYGKAVLVAKSQEEAAMLMREYVRGTPERINSKLASESVLRTHVLSLIASRFASSSDGVIEFLRGTLYMNQQNAFSLSLVISSVVSLLVQMGMLEESRGVLSATALGERVSRLYIDPLTAHRMVGTLKWEGQPVALTLAHALCSTPDMRTLYLRSNEFDDIESYIDEHSHQFYHIPLRDSGDYDTFIREVKTARLLLEWMDESPEDMLCSRYRVGPGDLRALVETARWLAHALTELARLVHSPHRGLASGLERRMQYGVREELLPLVALKGIGRVRARKLYNAGYRRAAELAQESPQTIATLLGEKTARKVLFDIGAEDRDAPASQKRLSEF